MVVFVDDDIGIGNGASASSPVSSFNAATDGDDGGGIGTTNDDSAIIASSFSMNDDDVVTVVVVVVSLSPSSPVPMDADGIAN